MTAAHEWDLWSTRARLVVTDQAALPRAVRLTEVLLEEVELAASRFRDDSEVRTLRPGPDGWTEVSPLLAELLQLSLDAAELTDGALDPTVGACLEDLGYDADIDEVRDQTRSAITIRPVPGWRSVQVRGRHVKVPAELRLDLGALAKAYAADAAAAQVATLLHTGVLVSLGGDIATAGPAPEGGWQVLVQDLETEPASHLAVHGGTALATSSTLHRVWRRGGRELLHHIIDPANGRPAPRDWRTVTVVAPTCLEANTLATAAVVKGRAGAAWLAGQGVPARLVDDHGRVHVLGGFPQEHASAEELSA